MHPSSFWRKVDDFYSIYRSKYQHAILTEEKRRENVTDFIGDMMTLLGDWYNTSGNNDKGS